MRSQFLIPEYAVCLMVHKSKCTLSPKFLAGGALDSLLSLFTFAFALAQLSQVNSGPTSLICIFLAVALTTAELA